MKSSKELIFVGIIIIVAVSFMTWLLGFYFPNYKMNLAKEEINKVIASDQSRIESNKLLLSKYTANNSPMDERKIKVIKIPIARIKTLQKKLKELSILKGQVARKDIMPEKSKELLDEIKERYRP